MPLLHAGRVQTHKQTLKRRISEYVVLTFTPSLFAALLIPGHASYAAQAAAAEAAAVEEIVVTGSRVVRDGYEAPTPLTVVGVEELQTAATQNVADYLNTMPSIIYRGNGSMSSGTAGLNGVNLRALGLNRTLVLLDGQRSVGVTADGIVDLNLFPQDLIQRVDVVTGGASAAYGSDAVAGVANFILNKNFVGIKGSTSGSITTYGDDKSWDVSATVGTALGGGRGHFLFSGEATYTAGIAINDREWNMQGWQFMTNPAYGTGAGQSTSVPQRILMDKVSVDNGIAGGIISAGPLKGIAFGEGGVPYKFVYGDVVFDPDMSGGQWQSATIRGNRLGAGLDTRQNTQSLFTRVSYDVTDGITAYVQAAYSHNWNRFWCCAREHNGNIVIKADNAFIPAEVRAQMTALKLTQFNMGSMHGDLMTQQPVNDRRVQRYVAGLDGKFDAVDTAWTWNAYYQKGVAYAHQQNLGSPRRAQFDKAVDAVRDPVTGLIVCRVNADSNPANDDRACIPYNVMGVNVNTKAVREYLYGYLDEDHPKSSLNFRVEKFTQDVASVAFNGEPFSLWAGPVSIAFGAEHRSEHVNGVNDIDSQNANWYTGNYLVFTAGSNVTEGFAETVIPLANNTVWAKSLELNAAYRGTDYSTSGFVSTWKLGLTWAPLDDIRVRGTLSRDIRAPNLNELFSAGTVSPPGIRNPFRNNDSEIPIARTTGNPALIPEKSNYSGLGAVIQPSFFPGFSASVDYWHLNIADAIGTVSVQNIIDLCYEGNRNFCDAISFQPDQRIREIRNQPFNLVNQIAAGLDFEAGYQLPLGSVVTSWDGNLALRMMATRFLKNYSSNGINPPTDSVGQNGGSGPPNWRWRGTATYTNDILNLGLIVRGVSSGVYSNQNIVCTSGCPVATSRNPTTNNNHIDGAVYFDTSFTYKFNVAEAVQMEAFLNVKNIMNTDPVIAAPGPGGFAYEAAPANGNLYDTLGRVFRAGVRFKM